MKKKIFLILIISFSFLFTLSKFPQNEVFARELPNGCCDTNDSDTDKANECFHNSQNLIYCYEINSAKKFYCDTQENCIKVKESVTSKDECINAIGWTWDDSKNKCYLLEKISPIKPKECYVNVGVPAGGQSQYKGIQTAIGCIPTEPQAFVSTFITWAIGIAGGVALLLMLFSAFGILTSAGDPEKLKASQERLTSAIIGLLFIIFSVFLLRIIGTPIMELGGS